MNDLVKIARKLKIRTNLRTIKQHSTPSKQMPCKQLKSFAGHLFGDFTLFTPFTPFTPFALFTPSLFSPPHCLYPPLLLC